MLLSEVPREPTRSVYSDMWGFPQSILASNLNQLKFRPDRYMVIGATAVCKWTEKGRRGEVGRGKEGLGRKKVNKGRRKGKEL